MKYCWSYSDSSGNMIAPGVILLGVLCVASICGECVGVPNAQEHFFMLLTLFSILYVAPLFWAFISSRRYQLDQNGITIKYFLGIHKLYLWSDISEIAICKIHYAAGSTKHCVGIRCAIGIENCVPSDAKSAREEWSSRTYEILRARKIVTIYYTDERFAEFLKYCPLEIKDYRNLSDYL